MKRIFYLFLFILIFLPAPIYALGIAGDLPDVLEINFEPNLIYRKEFFVVNSDEYSMDINMSVESELKDYVSISEYTFLLGPKSTASGIKPLNFTVSLPEKIEKPGPYKIIIYATQYKPEAPGQQGLGARYQIGYVFRVFVPYPGKYVEFTVKIENPNINQSMRFLVSAVNRGNQTIDNAYIKFYLYDPENRQVADFMTESKKIAPTEYVNFIKEWFVENVRPGRYRLKTEVWYDGEKLEQTKEFMIGSPTAKILNVMAEPIVEGMIGKITALVAGEWNERIPDMYIVTDIKKGDYSTSITSETFDLGPWEERNVTLFWDTSKSKGPGEYQGLANLYYFNQTYNTTFILTLKQQGLELSATIIVIIIIVALIALSAVYVFYYKKKGNKEKYTQKKLM